MGIKTKNNWGTSNKSGKKIIIKARIGKLTLFDFYCTIGEKKAVLTVFNFTASFDATKK